MAPRSSSDGPAPVLPHATVAEYLEHLAKERDVSPHTITAYERDLREFSEFLARYYDAAGWSWQGVDRIAMRSFLAHLARRGLGKRSMARTLSMLMIDTTLRATSEKLWSRPDNTLGGPFSSG